MYLVCHGSTLSRKGASGKPGAVHLDAKIDFKVLQAAMSDLPDVQREALILVGAGGLPFEEAAEICGVAVGTIKSRVSRARKAIVEILETNGAGFSDDSNMKAEDAFNDIMRQADDIAGVG